MRHTRAQSTFFFAFLIGVIALTFFVFLPFLVPLAVAATLAVVSYPLHRRMLALTKGNETIAAFLSLFCIAVVVLVPLTFIGGQVFNEAQDLFQRIDESPEALKESFEDMLGAYVRRFAPGLSIDIPGLIGKGFGFIASLVGPLFAGTAQTLLHFFLGAIALYYFLKDGPKFIQTLITLSPLPDTEDEKVLARLDTAINSIIRGTLIIAITQGIMTGIGLAIFGVPSPTLWGSLAAVGALVPGVGTAMVLAPAILFLFLTGKTVAGVGLLVWGIVAVGLIDNFLGPILVGRGVKIHPLFILFAVIGGIGFFGPVGFLLGPLVLSLLFALLDIYLQAEKKTMGAQS